MLTFDSLQVGCKEFQKKAFFQQSAVINSLNIPHENVDFHGKNFLHDERNNSNEH